MSYLCNLSGCVQQENVTEKTVNVSDTNKTLVKKEETKIENESILPAETTLNNSLEKYNKTILSNASQIPKLGDLCTGEGECKNFCLSNRGRCESYCKGSKNELCKIIFLPQEETEQTEKLQEMEPVLKNLGIKIEPWDRKTNMAGDFLFENKNYVDDKIFTEFAHRVINEMGDKLLPEIGFNVPVGTKVISPIEGVITDVNFFEPSQDYLISIKTHESSPWIVGFEHVYNVRIKPGDKVLVGQELAEVSPSYGKIEFGNVEINVWTGGQNIIKYCPFEFLDNSLKPMYKEKINRLANDWEEFIGKDVYKQEAWVAPGCLLHNITER
ncbi:hypothetical protein J4450_02090 [Candidatus Micrarchaeota archaeon]|nr:hypothetical protein [Candidatus Micrarchaeota archaeon]